MTEPSPHLSIHSERIRRLLLIAALALFALLLYVVIHHFLVALAWAAILVLTVWPLFIKVQRRWPGHPGSVSIVSMFALGLLILVPLAGVAVMMVGEAHDLGQTIYALLMGTHGDLKAFADKVPLFGEQLKDFLNWIRKDPANLKSFIEDNQERLLATGRNLANAVFQNFFDFFICMFCTYFLFRHGEVLGDQIRRGVRRLGGERLQGLMRHIQETVKAVVYGLVMTAVAQAVVSAFGFWLFGVPYPLMLGIMMFFISFIPFGPPMLWLPAAILLAKDGAYLNATLMFLYGATIISTMDNIFRPLFIGQATQMSVLLVFMGIIGGILSFGMLGLFLGPVVIAVGLALWRDWVQHRPEQDTAPKSA